MDNREVQETQADSRQREVVREAQDVRARVLDGLDALERELQRVKQDAEGIPADAGVPYKRRRRVWPWSQTMLS